jgi:hypothetical protein
MYNISVYTSIFIDKIVAAHFPSPSFKTKRGAFDTPLSFALIPTLKQVKPAGKEFLLFLCYDIRQR